MIVRELITLLGYRVDNQGLNRARTGVDRYVDKANSATKANKGLGMSFGGMATAALGFFGVMEGGRALLGTIAQAEKIKTALAAVMGSTDAAKAKMAELVSFAAKTPLTLEELAKGFIKLEGAGLDSSQAALQAYGDFASTKLDKTFIDLIDGVTDAAMGSFERLNEFDIKGSKNGQQIALTFQQVTEKMKFNSQSIEGYLQNIGKTKFAGAMEAQSKTLGGVWSTLQDNVKALLVIIGEAGLKDVLVELTKTFTLLAQKSKGVGKILGPFLGFFASLLGTNLIALISIVKTVWELLRSLFAELYDGLVVFGYFEGGIQDNAKAMRKFAIMTLLPLIALEDLIAFMKGEKSVIGDFVEEFEKMGGAFAFVANRLKYYRDQFADDLNMIQNDLSIWIEETVDLYKYLFLKIGQVYDAAVDRLANDIAIIVDLFWGMVDSIGKAFTAVGQFFVDLWNGILDTVASIIDSIIGMFNSMANAVKMVWVGLQTFITDMFESMLNAIILAINIPIKSMNKLAGQTVVKEISSVDFKKEKRKNYGEDLSTGFSAKEDLEKSRVSAESMFPSIVRPTEVVNPNINVASVAVTVEGSTNMGSEQIQDAVSSGVSQGQMQAYKEAQRDLEGGTNG